MKQILILFRKHVRNIKFWVCVALNLELELKFVTASWKDQFIKEEYIILVFGEPFKNFWRLNWPNLFLLLSFFTYCLSVPIKPSLNVLSGKVLILHWVCVTLANEKFSNTIIKPIFKSFENNSMKIKPSAGNFSNTSKSTLSETDEQLLYKHH